MNSYEQDQKLVQDAAALFPATFGLRAFPGDTFRIGLRSSYTSGSQVMLYTERLAADGRWQSFAKGTPAELQAEVIAAPKPGVYVVRYRQVKDSSQGTYDVIHAPTGNYMDCFDVRSWAQAHADHLNSLEGK
jgi:hypothetical protein